MPKKSHARATRAMIRRAIKRDGKLTVDTSQPGQLTKLTILSRMTKHGRLVRRRIDPTTVVFGPAPEKARRVTRAMVLDRDGWQCVRCETVLTQDSARIDHINLVPVRESSLSNRRALCRRCYVLRFDERYGMVHESAIPAAIREGTIPFWWRSLVWALVWE